MPNPIHTTDAFSQSFDYGTCDADGDGDFVTLSKLHDDVANLNLDASSEKQVLDFLQSIDANQDALIGVEEFESAYTNPLEFNRSGFLCVDLTAHAESQKQFPSHRLTPSLWQDLGMLIQGGLRDNGCEIPSYVVTTAHCDVSEIVTPLQIGASSSQTVLEQSTNEASPKQPDLKFENDRFWDENGTEYKVVDVKSQSPINLAQSSLTYRNGKFFDEKGNSFSLDQVLENVSDEIGQQILDSIEQ